jgi:hypothetical protein
MKKSEMINGLVQHELDWFNGMNESAKQEYLKDFFLNGIKGLKTYSDQEILKACYEDGVFLMEA